MEVKINREIRNYTESMFFGLSMRQCVFSFLAIAVAVGLYFLLKPYVGVETVSWVCILGAAPFAALGFVSYHGMPAERFIIVWLRSEIIEPRYLTASAVNSIYYEATKDVIAAYEKEGYKRHEQNRQKHNKAGSRKVHRPAQSTGRHTHPPCMERRHLSGGQ